MLNSNPETVSTDYDTSDRLYLEPVTLERALDVCALEQPLGVVVTLGGQTPLKLAHGLAEAGIPLLGDPLPAIDAAEDRGKFAARARGARTTGTALGRRGDAGRGARGRRADRVSGARPAALRPRRAAHAGRPRRPTDLEIHEPSLVDEFLEGALELDVDILCDGESGWVAGILEHIEPAGIHSGDSACVIPGPSVSPSARSRDPRDRKRARTPARGARPPQPAAGARGTASWR